MLSKCRINSDAKPFTAEVRVGKAGGGLPALSKIPPKAEANLSIAIGLEHQVEAARRHGFTTPDKVYIQLLLPF